MYIVHRYKRKSDLLKQFVFPFDVYNDYCYINTLFFLSNDNSKVKDHFGQDNGNFASIISKLTENKCSFVESTIEKKMSFNLTPFHDWLVRCFQELTGITATYRLV